MNKVILEPLDIVDDRPYASFEVIFLGGGLRDFKYQVKAYSEDHDELKLPDGIKQYYETKSAAYTCAWCLTVLATQKNKLEIDQWAKMHVRDDTLYTST